MTINQRVKQVRQSLKMSQARFAKALSMSTVMLPVLSWSIIM